MLVFQRFPYFVRGGFGMVARSDLAKPLGFYTATGSQTTVFAGRNELWRCKTLGLLPTKTLFCEGGKSAKLRRAYLVRQKLGINNTSTAKSSSRPSIIRKVNSSFEGAVKAA